MITTAEAPVGSRVLVNNGKLKIFKEGPNLWRSNASPDVTQTDVQVQWWLACRPHKSVLVVA